MILKDLFLFAFFENGNDLCEQVEVNNNLPEMYNYNHYYSRVAKRSMS